MVCLFVCLFVCIACWLNLLWLSTQPLFIHSFIMGVGQDNLVVRFCNQFVLEASCKGVLGCFLCSLGNLVARHGNSNFCCRMACHCPCIHLGCWQRTHLVVTFCSQCVLETPCIGLPDCFQCTLGNLVTRHVNSNICGGESLLQLS